MLVACVYCPCGMLNVRPLRNQEDMSLRYLPYGHVCVARRHILYKQ